MISGIINTAVNANLGNYLTAYSKLIIDLENGVTNKLGQPIFTAYPPTVTPPAPTGTVFTANLVGFNTATAANSVEGVTTSAATDTINTTIARLAGATVNGQGQATGEADTLNITDAITTAVTLGDGGAGGTITNVEKLVLKAGSTGLVTGPALTTGVTQISFEAATMFVVAANAQSITGSTGADVLNLNTSVANVTLDGGAGADVLNITGGGAMTGTSSIANIETVNANTLAAGATLTLAGSTATTVNLGVANLTSSGSGTPAIIVNATGGGGQTITLGGGGDTVNIGAGFGASQISTGAGDDTVLWASRLNFVPTSTVSGGAGNDTLTLGLGLATAADFASVSGFEVINDPTGLITAPDSLVAAGATLTYNSATGAGAGTTTVAIDFSAETNGTVNVAIGAGGGTFKAANNNLSDTITLAAGHAATTLNVANGAAASTGNSYARWFSTMDKVVGFNAAVDKFTLPAPVTRVFPITGVDLQSVAAFTAVFNAQMPGGSLAIGDVAVITSYDGRVFLFQNLDDSNLGPSDLMVEITGMTGTLTTANFTSVAPGGGGTVTPGGPNYTVTANSQTITGSAANETVAVGGIYKDVTLNLAGGTDTLTLANGAGLTDASTISGFEAVVLGTVPVLSVGVHNSLLALSPGAVTGLGGSGDNINLRPGGGSTTTTGLAGAEIYNLDGAMTFTLGAASQTVNTITGASTIQNGAFSALTGKFLFFAAGTTFSLSGPAPIDLTGASFQGFPINLALPTGASAIVFDDQTPRFSTITGAVVSTLTVNPRAGGSTAVNLPDIVGVGTIDLTTLFAAQTVTVGYSGATSVNIKAEDSSLIVNANNGASFAAAVTADGGNQSITFNNVGANSVSIGSAAGNTKVTGAGGNDTVNIDRADLSATDSLDGKGGSDTLKVGPGAAAGSDFNGVINFETIEDFQGRITSVETLIAGSTTLTYRVTGTGPANASFAAENDGALNFFFGSGGGIVEGTNSGLKDTYTLLAGHATATIDLTTAGPAPLLGNTVAYFSTVDTIAGFNASLDKIDVPRLVSTIRTGFSFTSSPTELNGTLPSLADADIVIAQSGGKTYVIQNLGGSNIDNGDFIVELTGVTGTWANGTFV